MPLLSVRDLGVTFTTDHLQINAVRDVNFDLEAGSKLGFVGESGSGKTTTALALMGMIPRPGKVTSGTAVLEGEDLLALSPREVIARRLTTVSYIPQGAMNSLNPVARVRNSVLDGMYDHGVRMSKAEARAFVADLMGKVGLPADTGDRYPHELSGGMKQRVCIAIAIAMKPKLIIADEPTSALDVITQRQVMETLDKVQSELGSALILIGHDMGLMAQFVDRLMIMRKGRIVEQGSTREIFNAPKESYTKTLITSVPAMPAPDASVFAAPHSAAGPSLPENDRLLSFENVSKVFKGGFFREDTTAVHPVDMAFSASKPRIVAVVGQSGSGKTTLGRLMLGFTPPSSGRVVYKGKDINASDHASRAAFRREVQAVFQDPYASFNPFYTVDHAFLVPLMRFGIAKTKAEAYDRMADSMQKVGLDPRAIFGSHAHQLSGGQRQRLMVARALSLRPKLLVADEPVSMVDASLRASILDSIRALRDDHGISVVYITHDLATAYRAADYVIVLYHGHIVEAGVPDEVIRAPQHPYSKLLVDSIPWPDPDHAWAGGRKLDADQMALAESAGAEAILRSRLDGFSIGASN